MLFRSRVLSRRKTPKIPSLYSRARTPVSHARAFPRWGAHRQPVVVTHLFGVTKILYICLNLIIYFMEKPCCSNSLLGSGLSVRDGRLINDGPCPEMGISKLARLRKESRISEKVDIQARGIMKADMYKHFNF